MGITDFGVTSSGVAYRYNTTQVLGNVTFGSLLGYTNRSSEPAPGVAFQLNANLAFQDGARTAVYWVQDIFILGYMGSGGDVGITGFADSAFNDTTGTFPAGSIEGNGSITGSSGNEFYGDSLGGSSVPGNYIQIYAPVSVLLRMISSTVHSVPQVAFEYSDGYGWQTFDVLHLPGMANWTDEGFVVDGTQYAPLLGSGYSYYDLEWVLTGLAGGYTAWVNSSNVNMTLQFWNGHNFQSVPNAFNFGADTAEKVQNATVTGEVTTGGDFPGAHIGAGPGTLQSLYGRAGVAILNVSSPLVPTGTLRLGSQSVPFDGGDANVTLAPGSYRLSLLNGSQTYATATVSLLGGQYLALTLPELSTVWFNETGLPAEMVWKVQVNGVSLHSNSASLSTLLLNGTYTYSVASVPGYRTTSYGGIVDVAGPTGVQIAWTEVTYPVVGSESGLPEGTPWSISVNDSTYSSSTSSLTAEFPNGTYGYTVGFVDGYAPVSRSGTFSIDAAPAAFTVDFVEESGYLVGSLFPSSAALTIDGTVNSVGSGGRFNITLPPGTYTVNATLSGYHPFSAIKMIAPGSATSIAISLAKVSSQPTNASGGPSVLTPELVGIGLVVAAVAALLAFVVARRRKT